MVQTIFFSGWQPLLHTLIIAGLAYPLMLLMLRISGHRTLSKMNAFDLVVTVALGSTLASAITSSDVSLAQGLLAFGLLIGMQFVLTWLAKRSHKLEAVLNGEPVLLFHRGRYMRGALEKVRITEDEVLAGMRSAGASSIDDVDSVILETNGQLSVVSQRATAGRPAPPKADESSTAHQVTA